MISIENYHRLRAEVTTNWKTGVVMVSVAAIAGQVYGKAAAAGVVLITVSNYQIVGRQIKVVSWMSLRKFLIVVAMLGNNHYFNVMSPQIMGNIAVALVLIDNFQISSINLDLSDQNEVLKQNEAKLEEAKKKLAAVKQRLLTFGQTVADAEAAKKTNTEEAEKRSKTIPPDLATDLENVNTLIETLIKSTEFNELIVHERTLRESLDSMLTTFTGICEKLQPILPKLDKIGTSIDATTAKLEVGVQLSAQLISDLTGVMKTLETYRRNI
jgi:hypothetical protein